MPATTTIGHVPPARRSPSLERTILLSVLLVLLLGTAFVLAPFWPWFVLALWTASMVHPVVDWLTRTIRGRRSAAGLVTLGLLVFITAPLAVGVISVATEAYELAQRAAMSPNTRQALEQLVSGDGSGVHVQDLLDLDFETALAVLQQHGVQAWTAASTVAGALTSLALGLFVYLAATYAAMVQGGRAYAWIEAQLPIAPRRFRRFKDAFIETGRGLFVGVALTGVAQAVVSSIAYAAVGVPRAAALGFVTFLASLIPSVGSALVWLPVSFGLLLTGHTTRALVLFAIGLGLVSTVDNLLRPMFTRWGKLELNPFLVLFSMLGGVLTVGGWGLILGPLVLRLALEAVVQVRDFSRANARAVSTSPPATSPSSSTPIE